MKLHLPAHGVRSLGLDSPSRLLERLDRAIDRSVFGAASTVLLVQIDRYAMLREVYDMATVQHLCREVVGRVREHIGRAAAIARLDGPTFGVVPRDPLCLPAAIALANLLVEATDVPIEVGGRRVQVTASVGLARVGPGCTADGVLRAATVAANRGSLQGGGRVVVHDQWMTEEAAATFALELDLRDAFTRHTWRIAYQPIVDANTGAVLGMEALLRLPGHASPAAHIARAEQNGMIVPLGLQIFDQACTDARAWRRTMPVSAIHVNVSALQLFEPDFADSVHRVLGACPLDAPAMTLELTESVMGTEPDRVSETLADVRDRGISISLDDFGTGYSSLTTLHRYPIDVVKLDRGFTIEVPTSERMRSVVKASIDLAHALDMKVVAEGVSEPEQRDVLRDLGCDAFQGYLICHPLPFESIMDWLADGPPPATEPLAATHREAMSQARHAEHVAGLATDVAERAAAHTPPLGVGAA